MTYYLWILLFGAFVITKADELDLADAFDDVVPTRKPDPVVPTRKPAPPPKAEGDGGLDLADAFLPEPEKPKKPNSDPKQPVAPPESGGEFSDADLFDGDNPGSSQADQYDDPSNDQPKELSQQWLKFLMLLGDNLPEGLHAWIENSKQVIVSLGERLLELLDLAEAEKES